MKKHPEATSQLLNKDGSIKNWNEGLGPRIIRERHEIFVHEDHFKFPPGAAGKDDHAQATLYLIPAVDGNYGKEMVRFWVD